METSSEVLVEVGTDAYRRLHHQRRRDAVTKIVYGRIFTTLDLIYKEGDMVINEPSPTIVE